MGRKANQNLRFNLDASLSPYLHFSPSLILTPRSGGLSPLVQSSILAKNEQAIGGNPCPTRRTALVWPLPQRCWY